jgi:hypothetical protein
MQTVDYQNFLCESFKSTPDLITKIYTEDGAEVLADALISTNWDLFQKCTPNSNDSYTNGGFADFFTLGVAHPKGPSYSRLQKMPIEHIAFEIVFNLRIDKYEGAFAFVVLETTTGQLLLGEFVGD